VISTFRAIYKCLYLNHFSRLSLNICCAIW